MSAASRSGAPCRNPVARGTQYNTRHKPSHSAGQRIAMLMLVSEPMSASCTRQRTVFQNCIAPLPYENNEGLGCRSTGRYATLNKKKDCRACNSLEPPHHRRGALQAVNFQRMKDKNQKGCHYSTIYSTAREDGGTSNNARVTSVIEASGGINIAKPYTVAGPAKASFRILSGRVADEKIEDPSTRFRS